MTAWHPTQWEVGETLAAPPAARLAAVLDLDPPLRAGDPLPPLWHWAYFLPTVPHADLGDDGHPRRGGFLPPVTGRRVWGGGRLTWHRPLRVGADASRASTVADVAAKDGRSGPLTVVTVRHRITTAAGLAVEEDQHLVYTEARPPPPNPARGRPPAATWERAVVPDEALLFRFSAATFNAHRIHYDRTYAAREGYPGLVVHGPLVALLLAELARGHGGGLRTFAYRARAPFSCGQPIHLRGGPGGDLAAYDASGEAGMTASFT